MNQFPNIGLYLSNTADKNKIIEQILQNKLLKEYFDLDALKGYLFSSITVQKLIDEELKHDHFLIKTEENDSLQTMSSGQQKKALLAYLLDKNPEYLVLDDVYSNIDKATQDHITESFSHQTHILYIQIFFRKRDILDCIDTVLSIDENNRVYKIEPASEFINAGLNESFFKHNFKLPEKFTEQHTFPDPLIELKNVSVKYEEKQVISNINWKICKGEFWQLVGPNGAGKSTIVSMISGDNPKAYGQNIILFGRKKGTGETIWDIKSKIGYFTPLMIDHFTRDDSVENMIISGLNDSVGLYIEPTDRQKDIARHWLEMLGEQFTKKSFRQLSIGQQRIVMVARAMVKQPPLLILDEPTIELDDENSILFIDMVNAIAKEKKIAIIYVSHRDEENLRPEKVFELVKAEKGYSGMIKKP